MEMLWLIGDVVVAYLEMWWLIDRYVVAHWWRCGGSLVGDVVAHYMYCSSAPDFWSRGPGLESGISHNDLDALQDHCIIL